MSRQRINLSASFGAPVRSRGASRFAPRPFAAPAPQGFGRPVLEETAEEAEFQQNRFEATGLEARDRHGTITPAEKERLGVVQAKMKDFWNGRGTAPPEFLLRGSREPEAPEPARESSSGQAPIQRAIAIGTEHLPRKLDETALAKHFKPEQIQQILKLNAEREKIYIFENRDHFISYFSAGAGFPPLVQNVSGPDLQRGHEMANAMRFATVYKPSTVQIPEHAQGGHDVPSMELPPSGPGHLWARTHEGTTPQYTMWQNRLQPPTHTTQIHTFGNPSNPSMWTSQGIFNMGGRVQPTQSQYLDPVTRSQSTYGGLPSESNQVRGHPMTLQQNQMSTDPLSSETFDNAQMLYTRESDGTKGGFSTFRYSQIENPSVRTMQPFNQVNVSSNPQVAMGMGIPQTDTIHISARQSNGTYEQMEFDNTVDYKTQIGQGNHFHNRLRQHVQSTTFPYEEVFERGQEFDDPQRHTYPGYMSPPPTPFLTPELRDTENTVKLSGRHIQNEPVVHNGDLWFIEEASYDDQNDETTCKLVKPYTKWHNL